MSSTTVGDPTTRLRPGRRYRVDVVAPQFVRDQVDAHPETALRIADEVAAASGRNLIVTDVFTGPSQDGQRQVIVVLCYVPESAVTVNEAGISPRLIVAALVAVLGVAVFSVYAVYQIGGDGVLGQGIARISGLMWGAVALGALWLVRSWR